MAQRSFGIVDEKTIRGRVEPSTKRICWSMELQLIKKHLISTKVTLNVRHVTDSQGKLLTRDYIVMHKILWCSREGLR